VRSSNFYYFPLALPFILIFLFLFVFVFTLLQIGVIGYAYEKIGISPRYIFSLLFLSLVGSGVNIPVVKLHSKDVLSGQEITFFGMRYIVPSVQKWTRTVVAINVGGAVIPTILSLYLLVKNGLYVQGLVGVTIVTIIVHWMARSVKGVGIAVPIFIPPVAAAGVGILLSQESAPALAYIAGTMGTLIGADLLNFGKIQGLGAPVASIGGAGTFDGIFLTGILAVLLA